MAHFLRIAAAMVVLATVVNAIGFFRSFLPHTSAPSGDTMFIVMGMGTLMMQFVLPLCMAAIMVGVASVIDRLDRNRGQSHTDD